MILNILYKRSVASCSYHPFANSIHCTVRLVRCRLFSKYFKCICDNATECICDNATEQRRPNRSILRGLDKVHTLSVAVSSGQIKRYAACDKVWMWLYAIISFISSLQRSVVLSSLRGGGDITYPVQSACWSLQIRWCTYFGDLLFGYKMRTKSAILK